MNKKPPGGLLINISLLLVSSALILLAIEGTLRIYAKITSSDACVFKEFKSVNMGDRLYRLSDNPRLIIELNPGAKTGPSGEKIRGGGITTISINKDGLRENRDYAIPKPPNTYRIAVLGDSVAFGFGVNATSSFPKIIEGVLEKQWVEKNVEVINFSVPGYNGGQKVATLEEKALRYEPDLVLMGWLVDDYAVPSYIFLSRLPLPKSVVKFLNAHSYLFACVREGLANAVQTANFGQYKEQYADGGYGLKISEGLFGELADFSREKNIPVIIAILPAWQAWDKNIEDGIVDINRLLEKIALEKKLYALDTLPLTKTLEERHKRPMTFYTISKSDIYHPNPAGHVFLAATIYNYLVQNKLIPITKLIDKVKLNRYEVTETDKSVFDYAYSYEYYFK